MLQKLAWAWLAALWLPSISSEAATDRRAWILDQLSFPPGLEPGPPAGVSGSLSHYADVFSGAVFGRIGLGAVEARATGQSLWFAGHGERGTAARPSLDGFTHLLGLEIARGVADGRGAYGRLGLGFLAALPRRAGHGRISFGTGVQAPDSGWRAGLAAAFWLSVTGGQGDALALQITCGRAVAETIWVGGRIAWLRRFQALPATGAVEQSALAFGPYVEAAFGKISVRLSLEAGAIVDTAVVGSVGSDVTDWPPPHGSLAVRASL